MLRRIGNNEIITFTDFIKDKLGESICDKFIPPYNEKFKSSFLFISSKFFGLETNFSYDIILTNPTATIIKLGFP